MKMKKFIIILLIITFLPTLAYTQGINKANDGAIEQYLNQYRNNQAKLRQIFQKMPKGGDLHHHYSGSVYSETYLKYLEDTDLWVNRNTFAIAKDNPARKERGEWSKVSSLKADGVWNDIKVKIIESWSILYYNYLSSPTDEHFFATFDNFNIPKDNTISEGLLNIKQRALNENVSYIETMFVMVGRLGKLDLDKSFDQSLLKLQINRSTQIADTLEKIYDYITKNIPEYKEIAQKHNNWVDSLHRALRLDDENFTIRYQNYVVRVIDPVSVFKDLLLSFESASKSDLIVGVNIVAPENNSISMRDYWLHTQFFKFFHNKYPNVKIAMHAGELTLGLVKPEDMSWHINDAVFESKANRIGHGVDIAYESHSDSILKYMATNKIAIEINLTSNAFILGVKNDEHPILLYNEYNVPIVISTDDAGVLRTDLTEQFIMLYHNYPLFQYPDLKKFIYNSIEYSFLSPNDKKRITDNLNKRFEEFEGRILGR